MQLLKTTILVFCLFIAGCSSTVSKFYSPCDNSGYKFSREELVRWAQ